MYASWRTRGTFPAVVFSRAIVMRAGFRRCRAAIDRIRAGIVGKPHVEHFVSFVEDENAERTQAQRFAPDVIERAAWRRHHDVRAPIQGADLLMHWRAAIQRQHADANALRVLVDGL